MKMNLALGISLLLMSQSAYSQSSVDVYPTKPLKNIVGFAAGGPTDIVARAVAEYIGRDLGQAVVVENKPGANSIIAAELVIRSPINLR